MPDQSVSVLRRRVGCVSYLNAKPLIEPLVGRSDIQVEFAVPSALASLLVTGAVDTALLPIVDYQTCPLELLLVPAGCIGCHGHTLTVRIFSRVPPDEITRLFADTDSHTSVILAQVILREFHNSAPEILPLPLARGEPVWDAMESVLLIGDKVINAAPPPGLYPWQLDLGDQWARNTGLPFVFAMWMMPASRPDPALAGLLAAARQAGDGMTDELVVRYAAARGWPADLLHRYYRHYLDYQVKPASREGIERFYQLAAGHNLLAVNRPIRYLDMA